MPVWDLLVIAFLIILNGFFAMSELAVMSSRRARLGHMAAEGIGARIHGPQHQGEFLRRLGIETRAASLKANSPRDKANEIARQGPVDHFPFQKLAVGHEHFDAVA